MKTLKKCLKAAKVEGRNWRKEPQAILRNYRTSPHQTTGVDPAVLLLKRPVRNKLTQTNFVDPVSEIVRKRDLSQKSKFKAHAHSKVYVKPSTISPGETVLVKRPFTASKGATVYDPTPLTVVDKKGSMITAQNKNRMVTRNSSFFKTLDQSVIKHDDDQSRDSGLDSPADIKHQQELPAARTRAHASDPSPSKPVSSSGMQANPTSSFSPIPESQASASHPVGQPALRRSSRRRVPRHILDL